MTLKFLFGTNRMIEIGKEDVIENVKYKDYAIVARKTDVLQHSDMKNRCMFSPSTGGFIKAYRKPERATWYGESVSCRVETDESMNPLYEELMKAGNYFKFGFEMYKTIYTIFAICPAGYKPTSIVTGIEWEPCTHEDMVEIIKVEEDLGHW